MGEFRTAVVVDELASRSSVARYENDFVAALESELPATVMDAAQMSNDEFDPDAFEIFMLG